MSDEKSLLQQIGDKERELGLHLKEIARETDGQVDAARRRAEALVAEADETGKRQALQFMEKEREATSAVTAELRSAGEKDIADIRKRGEPNITRAAEEIVRNVAMK
jgi:vacuolar-type H+-ATPase subunit H